MKLADALAPVLTRRFESQTMASGAAVTLQVGGLGTLPFHYRWQFNGANLPDAAGPMLSLPHLTCAQAGVYSVIVANAYGSVTNTATLSDLALNLYAGLTLCGPIGAKYRIEYLPDIGATNNWQTLLEELRLPNSPYQWIDWDSPNHPRRFYRAVLQP